MRFAVVACSRCRRPQAVELRFLRTRCRGCGDPMDLGEQKQLFTSDDEHAVQQAVARLGAQRAGQPIEGLAEALAAADVKRPVGVQALVGELAKLEGTFDAGAFAATVERLGVAGEPEKLLAALVRDSLVFEPRPGVFQFLG